MVKYQLDSDDYYADPIMWNDIETCPDGCVDVKVFFLHDNVVEEMCSCDVHWSKVKPDLWKLVD